MCVEAYLAGLLDGEGYIKANRWGVSVVVGMTDRQPLDLIADKYQINVNKQQVTRTGRQAWMVSVNGNKALSFLRDVRPYLLVKGNQADLALGFPIIERPKGKNLPMKDEIRATRDKIERELKNIRQIGTRKDRIRQRIKTTRFRLVRSRVLT